MLDSMQFFCEFLAFLICLMQFFFDSDFTLVLPIKIFLLNHESSLLDPVLLLLDQRIKLSQLLLFFSIVFFQFGGLKVEVLLIDKGILI